MAIVKMNKFNLIVPSTDREELLRKLQKFNYIHFLNIAENELFADMDLAGVHAEEALHTIDDNINKVSFCIDSLEKYDRRKKGLHEFKEGVATYEFKDLEKNVQMIDFENLYEQIKMNVDHKEYLHREIKRLEEKIAELTPWVALDVPIKLLFSFQQSDLHIGTIPNKLEENVREALNEKELTYYHIISETQQYTYILTVAHQQEASAVQHILMNHGFSKITLDYSETPKEEIIRLTKSINKLKTEFATVEEQFTTLSEQLNDLELLYDYFKMTRTRFAASENFLSTEKCNVMEGYIPTKFERKFEKIVKKQLNDEYYLQIEEAKENDPNVPILLENSKFFRSFESITAMYALPKYNEIDPTPWFTIFYALFFGMMVGDAGYGLLMLIATFLILKIFTLTNKQKSFIRFFYYLSFSTILWGVIFGGFFGDTIPLPALIDTGEEFNFLLILSIALGGVHLFFALAVQAYMDIKKGKLLDALFDVGFWYILLSGVIVYLLAGFISSVQPYKDLGLIIMIIGMVGILLTGGRHNKTIGGKLAGGLYGLYGMTSYISDFVSYSRLMALALASGFIAYAINMMVVMLFDIGWLGVILGIIVFIVGQGFNLFLSMLSGYVHSLRLTYVEFFGKFYEGGGKAFQHFRHESKYINIK